MSIFPVTNFIPDFINFKSKKVKNGSLEVFDRSFLATIGLICYKTHFKEEILRCVFKNKTFFLDLRDFRARNVYHGTIQEIRTEKIFGPGSIQNV